jgi:hypothetical protein
MQQRHHNQMMKPALHKSKTNSGPGIMLVVFLLMFITGCPNHKSQPTLLGDHTVAYLPKKTDGINANITLGLKTGKMTGKPIFTGTVFPIGEKERVFAMVSLHNFSDHQSVPHLFHIEWLNQNDRVIYRKKIALSGDDTTQTILSSISTAQRGAGNYTFRVFYFRELIAQKQFRLVKESLYRTALIQYPGATLTFCRKIDKSTGERIGVDSVFYGGPKKWLTAIADFQRRPVFDDVMRFRMEWIGPDNQINYNKLLTFLPKDSLKPVRSSVSLKSEKRPPGKYTVNLYFFQYLLARNSFTLLAEEKHTDKKIPKQHFGPVPIRLFVQKDQQPAEETQLNPVFYLSPGVKLHTSVDISRTSIDKEGEIIIQWINPTNKVFFKKAVALTSAESLTDIRSSISIDPDKRTPGQYAVRIMYQKKMAAEKRFRLIAD